MKKNLVRALMVSLILGGLFFQQTWARDTGDAAVRKEAQAFLNQIAAMFDKKDAEGLVKTMLPGSTLHYANGTDVTIEEWGKSAKEEFAGIATMKSKFKVEKAVAKGDSIVATYIETHNYTKTAQKGHKYRSVSRWSVTLAKTPQGLRATHFVEFSEKNTRDGKAFKPKTTPNPV